MVESRRGVFPSWERPSGRDRRSDVRRGQKPAPTGRPWRAVPALALLAAAALFACGCSYRSSGSLVIRGGPSLDAPFAALVKAYQKQNPQVDLTPNFMCPPCVLFQRPGEMPDLDLFASLGRFELDRLGQTGKVAFSRVTEIGRTSLVVVTSRQLAGAVSSIADLHRARIRKIGVGDPALTSVGFYAQQALTKAGLWRELESRFQYSRSGCELLKWLGLGRDIDAAVVFSVCVSKTDRDTYTVQDFPPELSPPVPLLLAMAQNAKNPASAEAFVRFAQTPEAQAILARYDVHPGQAP